MKAKYSVANKRVIFVFLQNSIYVRCERFEENRAFILTIAFTHRTSR